METLTPTVSSELANALEIIEREAKKISDAIDQIDHDEKREIDSLNTRHDAEVAALELKQSEETETVRGKFSQQRQPLRNQLVQLGRLAPMPTLDASAIQNEDFRRLYDYLNKLPSKRQRTMLITTALGIDNKMLKQAYQTYPSMFNRGGYSTGAWYSIKGYEDSEPSNRSSINFADQ